jgi:pimeloyl-ACP methyl ester carboxylesterase
VLINGVELHVRRFGDPALPMLVVIHGGPTWDHAYLLPQVAALADTAHVVLFDQRGCGRSSPMAADLLRPQFLADDVAALIRALGAGQADVLGFSYGGGIAMRVVDQHPDVVRRLILASTTAYPDFADPVPPERAALIPDVPWDLDLPGGELSRRMADAGVPSMIWDLDRAGEFRQVLATVRFTGDWNEPFAAGVLPPARPPDPAGALNAWGGPVLILHGAHDMTFPPEVARRLHAAVPASTLAEIPDAGHMTHFDNPAAWLAAIRSFSAGPVA